MARGGGVRFVPNPAGIKALGYTPAMLAWCMAKGSSIRDIAVAIAPVGDGEDGGHYKDQITVDRSPITSTGAGARVNARKFTSGWIEFGTSDTPAFAPLRTAADADGVELGGAEVQE